MQKNTVLAIFVLLFAALFFNGHAQAEQAEALPATTVKPTDGEIEIKLPDRWKFNKMEEKQTFWWAEFTDSDRVAAPFIFWGKNFGRRDLPLEDWGNNFIKRALTRFTENFSYDIERIEKKSVLLGSGQSVEFFLHRLRINGRVIREAAFAFLSSKNGDRRIFIGIYQSGDFGDVPGTIPVIARGIFFKE